MASADEMEQLRDVLKSTKTELENRNLTLRTIQKNFETLSAALYGEAVHHHCPFPGVCACSNALCLASRLHLKQRASAK
jgi:hypothetical protein